MPTNELNDLNLELLRLVGKTRVIARLQHLYDDGLIGLAGAQKIYHDAFGGRLIGVKIKRPSWIAKIATRIANFLLDTFTDKVQVC